jgi:hypothetical protein
LKYFCSKKKYFIFSDETILKHDSIQTRFIPLTINIGEVIEVNIEFKKTENWISSSWYSSLWTFTRVTVLDGDQQQRYINNLIVNLISVSFFFCSSRNFCPNESMITSGSSARFTSC